MGLICDDPCWPTKCFSHDTKVRGLFHAAAWKRNPFGPTQLPTSSAGKHALAALLRSELAQHCKNQRKKSPKGQDAFLRDSRTYWADDRYGDLGSLVQSSLSEPTATDSLLNLCQVVSDWHCPPISKGCCENDVYAKHWRWVTKNEMLCLLRPFRVEVLAGAKLVLILSVDVWCGDKEGRENIGVWNLKSQVCFSNSK